MEINGHTTRKQAIQKMNHNLVGVAKQNSEREKLAGTVEHLSLPNRGFTFNRKRYKHYSRKLTCPVAQAYLRPFNKIAPSRGQIKPQKTSVFIGPGQAIRKVYVAFRYKNAQVEVFDCLCVKTKQSHLPSLAICAFLMSALIVRRHDNHNAYAHELRQDKNLKLVSRLTNLLIFTP